MTVVDDGTTTNEDRLGAIGDIGFVLDELGLDDDARRGRRRQPVRRRHLRFRSRRRASGDAPVLAVRDVGDLARDATSTTRSRPTTTGG